MKLTMIMALGLVALFTSCEKKGETPKQTADKAVHKTEEAVDSATHKIK